MVKWEIGDFADIRFKYSITSLAWNGTSIEERNEIRFQVKILF
jgi:hypothetical protein